MNSIVKIDDSTNEDKEKIESLLIPEVRVRPGMYDSETRKTMPNFSMEKEFETISIKLNQALGHNGLKVAGHILGKMWKNIRDRCQKSMKKNKPDQVPLDLKFLIPFLKSGQGVPAAAQEFGSEIIYQQDSTSQTLCHSQDCFAPSTSTQISSASSKSTASQMSSAASIGQVRVPTITLTAEDGSQMAILIRELPPAMIPLTKKLKDRAELEREYKYHKQIELSKNKDRTLGRMPDQRLVDTNFKKRKSDQMTGTSGFTRDLEEFINDSENNEMVNNYCDILIDQLKHVSDNKKVTILNRLLQIANRYQ